jgi:hypothetical protein
MCDISIKTDLTAKVVYKVAYKFDGKYYAIFSGMELKVGKVNNTLTIPEEYLSSVWLISYDDHISFYNPNMIGKTSGFEKYEHARFLENRIYDLEGCMVILKITLGGEIMQGTLSGIFSTIEGKTFAGTEILTMEEIEEIDY